MFAIFVSALTCTRRMREHSLVIFSWIKAERSQRDLSWLTEEPVVYPYNYTKFVIFVSVGEHQHRYYFLRNRSRYDRSCMLIREPIVYPNPQTPESTTSPFLRNRSGSKLRRQLDRSCSIDEKRCFVNRNCCGEFAVFKTESPWSVNIIGRTLYTECVHVVNIGTIATTKFDGSVKFYSWYIPNNQYPSNHRS